MKWTKAKDQLPEPFKVVPCKYTPDSPDPRKDTELHWGFVHKDGHWANQWQHHQVEWLDETESSSSPPTDESALEKEAQAVFPTDPNMPYRYNQEQSLMQNGYIKGRRKSLSELAAIAENCAKLQISNGEDIVMLEGNAANMGLLLMDKDGEIEGLKNEVVTLTERLERITMERNSLEEELALYRLEK
jgi:hypothetical protein